MHHKMMTKYEASQIIGIRIIQLSENAPIMCGFDTKDTLLKIAATELLEGKININIQRPLPHNKFYTVNVKDLKVPEDLHSLLRTFDSAV